MGLERPLKGVLVTATLMAVAGAILAGVQQLTHERVRANVTAAERQVVRELVGVAAAVPNESLALCERGLVLKRDTARGYGGDVDYIVAFGTDGEIAGVRVLWHAETPGFADILLPQSDWLAGFRGGTVHAVTGATITSRAVIDGVNDTTGRHMQAESPCPPTASERPGPDTALGVRHAGSPSAPLRRLRTEPPASVPSLPATFVPREALP